MRVEDLKVKIFADGADAEAMKAEAGDLLLFAADKLKIVWTRFGTTLFWTIRLLNL